MSAYIYPRFHFENVSTVFRPHYSGGILGKLGKGDHMTFATASFSNSHCLESVFEKSRFRDGLVWTVGLNLEIKPRFQISSSGVVWTLHYKSEWKEPNVVLINVVNS